MSRRPGVSTRLLPFLLLLIFFAAVFALTLAIQPAACADGHWCEGFDVAGIGAFLEAMQPYGGELVVGGDGPLARWDGAAWHLFPAGLTQPEGYPGEVLAMTLFEGDLVVAGYFSDAGGMPASNIARWDGTSWSAFGAGLDGIVDDVTVYGGELVAVGRFTTTGGSSVVNRVARWDGAAWQPLGSGADGSVYAAIVWNDLLVIGGSFTAAGGSAGPRVAAWDGTSWNPLGTGPGYRLLDLAVFEGDLVATGYGSLDTPVHRWDGTSWTPLGSWPYGEGLALAVYGDVLYLGNGSVFSWDGTSWQPVGGGLGSGSYCDWCGAYALVEFEGDLYAGGYFSLAGGLVVNNIARWDEAAWNPLHPGWGVSGRITALTVHDGTLFAGGAFYGAGTVPANHVARWNGEGWDHLAEGIWDDGEFPGAVEAMVGFGGDLIATGFLPGAGTLHDPGNVATWDGSAWGTLGAGINGWGEALASDGGSLYLGGSFSSAGGVAAQDIARWDGSAWSALGSGVNDQIRTLAAKDGALYAGGEFTEAGGAPANRVASWDGTAWSALGSGMNSDVYALAFYQDDLYAGGWFDEADGAPADHIARWNGTAWEPVGSGLDERVYALTVYHGELFAGGRFTHAGAVAANHLARWDGAAWSPVDKGVNDDVFALAVFEDALWVGGDFRAAGGLVSIHVARWQGAATSVPGVAAGVAPAPRWLAASPNPFRSGVSLTFALASPGPANLAIYDVTGRAVSTLVDGPVSAGTQTRAWDGTIAGGKASPPGVYFAVLRADGRTTIEKLLLIR